MGKFMMTTSAKSEGTTETPSQGTQPKGARAAARKTPDMLVADAVQNEPSGKALLAASTKNGRGSTPAMRMSMCFHNNPTK